MLLKGQARISVAVSAVRVVCLAVICTGKAAWSVRQPVCVAL